MKQALIFIFICLAIGCSTTKKISNSLSGTWTAIRGEIGGKELPPVDLEKIKVILTDTSYTRIDEGRYKSFGKGVLKYGNNKMDFYEKEGDNSGKHVTAIYKFENEQLTICYDLGDNYPTSFETKSKPTLRLLVFKKQTK
ncbi:MAG TPA: TIGR03067 domain-containing protein [Bacteroidia bacterium]|jgi:uncharacterized protein (TIGR03067 family)|nr:TIGR03067 domain-containing protein [Bacteroidia bacterium]